jgi:aspartate aminotransferase-like enzyme
MTPPGLVMVAAGPRALEANKTAKLPRFYFDWGLALKRMKVWQHPSTPPISIFYALDQGLEMMLAEGRQNIFVRHLQAGEYVRQRARTIGLELLADHQHASNTVTAIRLPETVDGKGLLKKIRETDGIVFAGGQEHLEGKIFRIGHLGFFTEDDLKEAMDVMERRLPEFGFKR